MTRRHAPKADPAPATAQTPPITSPAEEATAPIDIDPEAAPAQMVTPEIVHDDTRANGVAPPPPVTVKEHFGSDAIDTSAGNNPNDANQGNGAEPYRPSIDEAVDALLQHPAFATAIENMVEAFVGKHAAQRDVHSERVDIPSPDLDTTMAAAVQDDNALAADVAAHERARVDARNEAIVVAREDFRKAMQPVDLGPAGLDLKHVTKASLLLDDGTAFSIDFKRDVGVERLTVRDYDVALTFPPIQIGEGMPEQFYARGVVLTLELDGGSPLALRSELVQPILVGGGHVAQLGENSLVFRIRP